LTGAEREALILARSLTEGCLVTARFCPGKKHGRIVLSDGDRRVSVAVSSSPSDRRRMRNIRSLMRRKIAGLISDQEGLNGPPGARCSGD